MSKKETTDDTNEYSEVITISDPLIEPFFITKDRYCYTVNLKTKTNPKYTEKGDSKEIIKSIGHYSSLAHALKVIGKDKVQFKKEYNNINEYIDEFKRVNEEVYKFLQKYTNE